MTTLRLFFFLFIMLKVQKQVISPWSEGMETVEVGTVQVV